MRIQAKEKYTYREEYLLLGDFKDHLEQFGHDDFSLVYSKRISPALTDNQTWQAVFNHIQIQSYTPAYIKLSGDGVSLYITNIKRVVELVYSDCTEYVIISNDADTGNTPVHSVVRIRMKQVNPSF